MRKIRIKERIRSFKNKVDKDNITLVGPFVGELSWELYRFAPYIIYLKKQNMKRKFMIFTRPTRFDLYGRYADYLIPLYLKNDDPKFHSCFTTEDFNENMYNKLIDNLKLRYQKDFNFTEIIKPNITEFNSRVRWQFPRDKMDYSFKPRIKNKTFVDDFCEGDKLVLIDRDIKESSKKYNIIYLDKFIETIDEDSSYTKIGCMIELIKRCKFVISSINSITTQIALLVKTPVFLNNETVIYFDRISLYNPLKTGVYIYRKGIL